MLGKDSCSTQRELTGVESRLEGGQAVVLQHVKEGLGAMVNTVLPAQRVGTHRLSGIIEAEEENFGVLVQETLEKRPRQSEHTRAG